MTQNDDTREVVCTPEELKLAQGLQPSEIGFEAWYMDDDTETDQREPHKQDPNVPCPPEKLKQLGILAWKLDTKNDPKLAAIRKVRGYSYGDEVCVAEGKLPEYEKKIKIFYEEHIHEDEEIRFILDGSGYFDVRDEKDRWIRIALKAGDLIVIPAGCYHRYTNDVENNVRCMRLFSGVPVWTAHNRPQEKNQVRSNYVKEFLSPIVEAK